MSSDFGGDAMSDDSTLPAWFREAFEQALAQLGWRLVRWQEKEAIVADSKSSETSYGLENILRLTASLPEDQRLDRIVEHLNQVNSIRDPGSLNGVRERLFPRLRAPLEDEKLNAELWSTPFQDTGLICVLVVDSPQAVTYVTRDMVEESGRPGEDWFHLAVDNLRIVTSAEQIVEVANDLFGVGTADSLDAARGLLLEWFVPNPDPNGYIVSVPNRDRLYFFPVGDSPFDNRFARQLIQTLKDHQEGAYAICDSIFWVHDGDWELIEWEWDGKELFVDQPEQLKALLGEGS
jgi:hypothetical protein